MYNTLLVESGQNFIIITNLNNKAIISQNGIMLRCTHEKSTNQDRQEINNSDWLL